VTPVHSDVKRSREENEHADLPCLSGRTGQPQPETTCGQCQARYRIRTLCPACGQELERLRACGAVDYFCNHCNTLVSKRTVLFEAQPDKA